ncbi:MAG: low temperature requirement protein A [Desertimonas sp.]
MSSPAPLHRRSPVVGRDPDEPHRVANTLELLYDLVFVVAFGVAGSNVAHQLAERHFTGALVGFGVSMFAVIWAWINFAWYASAYDNDDWQYRTLTMFQMVGVAIVALGIDPLFESLAAGGVVDNRAMVLGYVVMRVALLGQWLRVARHDRTGRPAALTYVATVGIAQVAWVAVAVAELSLGGFLAAAAVLFLVELAGPMIAERRRPTPWHPHHIAERYGLLVIVTLGEGIVGTITALRAVITVEGWTVDVAVIGLAGIAVTWGLWWVYFLLPHGEALSLHRERSFVWGYGHMVLFAALAGVGAGLHVAALAVERHSGLGSTATIAATAIPLAIALVSIYALYGHLVHAFDPFHLALLAMTGLVVAASLTMAATGVEMAWCLLTLASAPMVSIVGYELHGHDHLDRALAADSPHRR